MTLQEMRERRKTLEVELGGMNTTIAERRSAGKSGAELWTGDEQAKFDKLTEEIGQLDGDIKLSLLHVRRVQLRAVQ